MANWRGRQRHGILDGLIRLAGPALLSTANCVWTVISPHGSAHPLPEPISIAGAVADADADISGRRPQGFLLPVAGFFQIFN